MRNLNLRSLKKLSSSRITTKFYSHNKAWTKDRSNPRESSNIKILVRLLMNLKVSTVTNMTSISKLKQNHRLVKFLLPVIWRPKDKISKPVKRENWLRVSLKMKLGKVVETIMIDQFDNLFIQSVGFKFRLIC